MALNLNAFYRWRDYFKFLFRASENTLFHLYGFKEDEYTNHNAQPKKSKTAHHREQKYDRGHQQHQQQQQQQQAPEWKVDHKAFDQWKDGMTGVPLIDANMRELKATGYMSNRGRQNVADFLAGQMHVDWRSALLSRCHTASLTDAVSSGS